VARRITPRPNDSASNEERLKNTISNMEAAEEAMSFADGKELASIKKANARREESIDGLRSEINAQDESRINGFHEYL